MSNCLYLDINLVSKWLCWYIQYYQSPDRITYWQMKKMWMKWHRLGKQGQWSLKTITNVWLIPQQNYHMCMWSPSSFTSTNYNFYYEWGQNFTERFDGMFQCVMCLISILVAWCTLSLGNWSGNRLPQNIQTRLSLQQDISYTKHISLKTRHFTTYFGQTWDYRCLTRSSSHLDKAVSIRSTIRNTMTSRGLTTRNVAPS